MITENISFRFLLCIVLAFPLSLMAQGRLSDNEADYYVDNIGGNQVTATGLSGEDKGDDSRRLNEIIDSLSVKGGGVIYINKVKDKENIYLRDVNLKDRIHLKISPDVTFKPWCGENTPRNIFMIHAGRTGKVSDIAVTNLDETSTDTTSYFNVVFDRDQINRVKFIDFTAAYNFKVAGIRFYDTHTVWCNLECNLNPSQSRKEGDLPAQGVMKNIYSTGNHVGYGIVQIRAGKRILFRNLDCEGGAALRIESGIPMRIQEKEATIDHIVGRDIKLKNGRAAVMMSPHRIEQGRVDVSGITSINSQYALVLENGFYDRKGDVENLGTFSKDSYVGGFKQVVGGYGAQITKKYWKLYPCEEQRLIKESFADSPDNEGAVWRSLSLIDYVSHPDHGCNCGSQPQGCYTINLELPEKGVVSGEFAVKDFVYEDTKQYLDCDN